MTDPNMSDDVWFVRCARVSIQDPMAGAVRSLMFYGPYLQEEARRRARSLVTRYGLGSHWACHGSVVNDMIRREKTEADEFAFRLELDIATKWFGLPGPPGTVMTYSEHQDQDTRQIRWIAGCDAHLAAHPGAHRDAHPGVHIADPRSAHRDGSKT